MDYGGKKVIKKILKVKITNKDKKEFNKTDIGKELYSKKYNGLIILSIGLLMVILFGLIIDAGDIVNNLVLIVCFILSVFGSYPIGLYYGELYKYVIGKNNYKSGTKND